MKLDPKKENRDLCHTSIDLLASKCRAWFDREGIKGNFWFADEENTLPEFDLQSPLHVILFGGYFRRIFESGNWIFPKMFLWVLSHRVKEVLVQLMGFPEECIGVIPRHQLFKTEGKGGEVPIDLSVPTTFVFAGRLSPTKNIEMILRTVFFLQTEHALPVRLEMFGDFDNEVHPDHGRREKVDYQEHIRQLIENLEWKIPPKLNPKMGADKWCIQNFENPVYVNFSTFVWEDFDVSLAQIEEKEWPAFVTNWGGHKEARHRFVHKIFSGYVGHSHEPSAVIRLKARHLAAVISRKRSLEQWESSTEEVFFPKELDLEKLDQIRRSLVHRLGRHSLKIQREGVEAFADTKKGQLFFSNYRLLFSGKESPRDFWLVLVNDFHRTSNPLLKDMERMCHEILDAAFRERKEVMFISAREINQPWNAMHLATASRVIFPFYSPRFDSLVQSLKESMNRDAVFVTQSPVRSP